MTASENDGCEKKKKNDTRLPTLVADYSITSAGNSTVRVFLFILSCLLPVVYFNSINSTPSSIFFFPLGISFAARGLIQLCALLRSSLRSHFTFSLAYLWHFSGRLKVLVLGFCSAVCFLSILLDTLTPPSASLSPLIVILRFSQWPPLFLASPP